MSLTVAAAGRRALLVGLAAGSAAAAGVGGLQAQAAGPLRATEPDVSNLPGSLREAALMAAPSIVNVDTEIVGRLHDSSTGQDASYDLGFGGTGFFVSSDGYIVTAAHVAVPTEEQIQIDFVDQRIDDEHHCTRTTTDSCQSVEDQYEPDLLSRTTVTDVQVTVRVQTQDMTADNLGMNATVTASSPSGAKDVAVLKIEMSDAPVLVLAHAPTSIGAPVAVEGYPESRQDAPDPLIPTVTSGRITDIRSGDAGFAPAATVVETDAAIEHGNSGGPGIDAAGAVVGLVSYGPSIGRNYLISAEDIAGLLGTTPAANALGRADRLWRDGLSAQANGDATTARRDFADCSAIGTIEVGCRARAGDTGASRGPLAQSGSGADSVAPAATTVLSGAQAAAWMGGGVAIGLFLGAGTTLVLTRVLPRRRDPRTPAGGWGGQPMVGWSWQWGPNGWTLVPGARLEPPPVAEWPPPPAAQPPAA